MKKIFVLGSINTDLVISCDRFPSQGETVNGHGFFENSGGKGANQATAASKLGGSVYLIAKVGSDAYGDNNLRYLQANGVNVDFVKHGQGNTGKAIVINSQNDNRILIEAGCNHQIDRDQIDQALALACNGDIFVTQLETNLDMIYYGLKKAKKKGMVTLLNAAPAAEIEETYYKYIDYLILNEVETNFILNIQPKDLQSQKLAYEKARKMGIKNLMITLGAAGSILFTPEKYHFSESIPVEVVDTTGAGDTYVGAFALSLCENKPYDVGMAFASKASSLTVQRKGAQQSMPDISEVKQDKEGKNDQ